MDQPDKDRSGSGDWERAIGGQLSTVAFQFHSTAIIVASDHGYENVYRTFQPNVLLKQAGLITDLHADQWRAEWYQQGDYAFLVSKDPSDRAAL